MNKLDKQYTDLLQDIIDNGIVKGDRTGTGTVSVFGREIRHNMADGFPLLTTKKMPWKTMVTELVWFLRGDTNIRYLVQNGCNIWNGDAYKKYERATHHMLGMDDLTMKEFVEKIKTDDEFAKEWGELGPIYGAQWRNWGEHKEINYILGTTTIRKKGIDQIVKLIHDLKNNPDSRRLIVNAWNVGEIENMTLPPCHYGFQVWTRKTTREEKIVHPGKYRAISLMWNQRSVDTFLGLPFNIASYGLLLEILAKEVNMIPGELIGQLGDTHLYSNHIEQAKEQIGRELNLDERIACKPDYLDVIDINEIEGALGVEREWVLEQAKDDDPLLNWAGRTIILDTLGVPKRSVEPYPLPSIEIADEVKWKEGDCLPYYSPSDFKLVDYQSHPTIKAPLSN